MPSNSGQTSTKVLKDAGKVLGMTDYGLDVYLNNDPGAARKLIRSFAASLVSQAPAKVRRELTEKIAADKQAARKAEKVARTTAPDNSVPSKVDTRTDAQKAAGQQTDDAGYDPRDGGKVGTQNPPGGKQEE